MTEKSTVSYRLPIFGSSSTQLYFFAGAVLTLCTISLMDWVGEHSAAYAPIFVDLFVFGDRAGAICTTLILIVAAAFPMQERGRQALAWIANNRTWVAVAVFALMCAGSWISYRNHPLAMDEYAAYFQSEVFAAGKLTGRFPVPLLDWLIPPPFQNAFLIVSRASGEVASVYWPSFALLLAPFTWLGIPWACNPAISAATIFAMHRLASMLFADREAVGLALLLTIASPVFFADGFSYYSMPAHLLANTLYAILLLRPTIKRCVLAGFIGSIALTLHNPIPHIFFAAPWIVWLFTRENGLRHALALCAGYLPLCVILGIGWFVFTNELIQVAGNGAAHLSANFSWPTTAILWARLVGVAKLWLWAVPGLPLLAALSAWKFRHEAWCRLLAASALLTLLGYLFVAPDQGHGWGYRYFHSAWLALPILGAAYFSRRHESGLRQFVTTCALLSLLVGIPFRAMQIREVVDRQLQQAPVSASHKPQVIFVDARYSFYGADLVQNDPFLRNPKTRLLGRSAYENSRLMRQYFPDYRRVRTERYGEIWEH